MAIMIAAKAASSIEGANHNIMSAREPEGSLLTLGERRNYGVMKSRYNVRKRLDYDDRIRRG